MKDTANGIYGETVRKNIIYVHKSATKNWIERQNDNTVVEYWQRTDHYYFANLIRIEEIDDDGYNEEEETIPLQL